MKGVVAAVVLVASAVTGCSSEATPAEVEPLASGSLTASASGAPLTEPPPTLTPAPAEWTEQIMPTAATALSAEGASAFTRFFFDEVNRAYKTGDSHRVAQLSDPDCNSCKSIVSDVDRLTKAHLTVEGTRFAMDFVETAPIEPDRTIVDFRFDADPYIELQADKAVVRKLPAQQDVVGQARLKRVGDVWRMYGLRLLSE